jgi:hypothetical protein
MIMIPMMIFLLILPTISVRKRVNNGYLYLTLNEEKFDKMQSRPAYLEGDQRSKEKLIIKINFRRIVFTKIGLIEVP